MKLQNMIETYNLDFKGLLHYPDLRIKSESMTFLSGESGCGKSTLLKLLNGTLSPTAGIIYYQATDIAAIETIRLRREILLVSQSTFLFSGSIYENFAAFYQSRDLLMPKEKEMQKFLCICQLDIPLDSSCDTMSGGERQRIYHAIALSFQPKVLLLDEPTSALDANTADKFFAQMKAYCSASKITVIVISHDDILTNRYADQQILLRKDRK